MNTYYYVSFRKFIPLVVLLTFGLFAFMPRSSQAQVSTYTFKTSGGFALPSNANVLWTGYSGARYSNLVSAPINLGFSFKFDGVTYTQMLVYSKGIISLGTTQQGTTAGSYQNDLSKASQPVIAGFWGGISGYIGRQSVSLTGGSSSSTWSSWNCNTKPDIEYQMTGLAPFRVMTIAWNFIDVTGIEGKSTWQVRLYESTNAIEIYYKHMTSVSECAQDWGSQNIPTYASIGIANGPANFMSITPTGGTNATKSTSTASNTINLQSSKIGDGTLYTFSIPPNVQLSTFPKILNFGIVQAGFTSSPLCTTVQSAGTDPSTPLIINSATITGSSDFSISSVPPSNSYPAGATGQYCIVFKPSQAGVRQATLTINSTGRDSGVQSIKLTGFGIVADLSIDSLTRFKKTRTRLGDSLTQYVHITSTGQAPLFFSGITLSGPDAGQYFISYLPVNPLQPGQTDSIGITYVPTIEGRHLATLTITSNSFTFPVVTVSLNGTGTLPHIVVTPPLLLFDSTKEGQTVCKTIDIWNPGTDTLKIFQNLLSSNDGDFHYTGLTGRDTLIAPDQHKTVTICFTPVQQGTRQARLVLRTNIIKTFETPRRDTSGIVAIDIHGTGVPFGVFANSVSGLPFIDSAVVGVTVCRTDTLKNVGDADILVKGLVIAGLGGTPATDFTYSGLPAFPFVLKARTSIWFTICGTPDKQGLLTGTGTVSGTTSGSNIAAVLPLAIFGFKTCISPSPITLFSSPQVLLPNNGSDSTLCDTITNCGDIAAIYHAVISGLSKADYTVTPAVSGTVAPKGTAVFCVKYKPSAVGVSPASLDVNGSDGTGAKVPLNGADGCAILTNPDVPQIPETGDNEKKIFTFTIRNNGTFPWTPGTESILPAGSPYKVISILPVPIPPNGTATVTMEFHPPFGSQGNTITAKISWPNGGPCGDTLSIDLSGKSVQSSVSETVVNGFTLDQSYPNPTKGKTSFTYSTPAETEVHITLVDMTGNLVRTLITGRVSEGLHTVNFDASDLASGTYVYLLESGSTRLVRQLILTR